MTTAEYVAQRFASPGWPVRRLAKQDDGISIPDTPAPLLEQCDAVFRARVRGWLIGGLE